MLVAMIAAGGGQHNESGQGKEEDALTTAAENVIGRGQVVGQLQQRGWQRGGGGGG